MSNRHLPAGQNIQGGGPGGMNGGDMNNGMGGGRRRGHQPQYMNSFYNTHMSPWQNYAPYPQQQPYYGIPQYQGGGLPSPGYMQHQPYTRSPQSMHQYVPMAGVSVSSGYHRQPQQSPSLSTPYQPPTLAPLPPHTPPSIHSPQPLPPVVPIATSQVVEQASLPLPPPPPPAVEPVKELVHEPEVETTQEPFRPPLPWYSCPPPEFPVRTRVKKQKKQLAFKAQTVTLPRIEQVDNQGEPNTTALETIADAGVQPPIADGHGTTINKSRESDNSPVSASNAAAVSVAITQSPTTTTTPIIQHDEQEASKAGKIDEVLKPAESVNDSIGTPSTTVTTSEADTKSTEVSSVPAPRAPPSSWANLFAKPVVKTPIAVPAQNGNTSAEGPTIETEEAKPTTEAPLVPPTFVKSTSNAVGEAVRAYQVSSKGNIPFLEPRGLINTGNMCYMNSVLQVLIFCLPFYDFLDQVSQKAAHSFKSDTPLIDAMIMFMREYKVLKSAPSVDQLNRLLKNEDLERYGEPFTPEFVYEAIRQLSRFASMRRGHQQDAEEFLGFLLQSLDDECTHVMSTLTAESPKVKTSGIAGTDVADASDDWLEVGRKQRSAVTRSSGHDSSTPIAKIFGGLLRSEFRVPGLKESITKERYQPLQLDIGSPDVRNVVDALRGLTRPERLQGDFNSPRGKDVTATKQVYIDSLPPVLILHLKRFQFDAEGNGTIKIWKNVGYPLDLEIPREALSRQTRTDMGEGSMPKYKLISVVYHHGKNASGGHYTVDVRRQDDREWIRLDDTVIRRVRSEDVAESGSEPDAKEHRKEDSSTASANRFGLIGDEDAGDDDGWKQVTAPTGGKQRYSAVVNGASNGATKEKSQKDGFKDNKVAYLLFYQRV